MSRIGKQPITVPSGVDVTLDGSHVTVKGPKGTLERDVPGDITVAPGGRRRSLVERPDDERENRALHGLTRSLVNNMVVGVSDGSAKELEIVGVGYRATAAGPRPRSTSPLGFCHPVTVDAPEGITFEVPAPDPHHRARASTRSSSARSPPTSARSASPSPTRARASATPASACCARPARRRSSDEERSQRCTNRQVARDRRHRRVRKKVRGTAERPRLAVFRSNKHIYAQVIDDVHGRTLAAASTVETDVRAAPTGNVAAAKQVGKLVGERAKAAGVDTVVFDRGGFLYHGRVAGIADAAREAGLEF